MRIFVLLTVCAAAAYASPAVNVQSQRIVGGSVTTVDNYPSISAFLYTPDGVNFQHICGSSILNERTILTAAHCLLEDVPALYRIRVGSTWSNSGGATHNIIRFIGHPNYSIYTLDSDIAIVHTASFISYNNVVQPAFIAGPNYIVPDNASVWAAGWGAISFAGPWSEQLRHVEMWNINADLCASFYSGYFTTNMLCAGLLNVGGVAQCSGDSGGPLYHQGVVVGVCSFGGECGGPNTPTVNVKVSEFTSWIQTNALS